LNNNYKLNIVKNMTYLTDEYKATLINQDESETEEGTEEKTEEETEEELGEETKGPEEEDEEM